jgi:hypothetical protein
MATPESPKAVDDCQTSAHQVQGTENNFLLITCARPPQVRLSLKGIYLSCTKHTRDKHYKIVHH